MGETVEIGSSVSFKRIGDGGSGWVSRWSLEAPFPLRIGDGGSCGWVKRWSLEAGWVSRC